MSAHSKERPQVLPLSTGELTLEMILGASGLECRPIVLHMKLKIGFKADKYCSTIVHEARKLALEKSSSLNWLTSYISPEDRAG